MSVRKRDRMIIPKPAGGFHIRRVSPQCTDRESLKRRGIRVGRIRFVDDTDEPSVTLVTCYPFYYVGSVPMRFIVKATYEWPATGAAEPSRFQSGDTS